MDTTTTFAASAFLLDDAELARFLSPALFVDLDRVRANLAAMARHLGGDMDRWRPHVKTAKIPAMFRAVAEAGVRSFKCATTREAAELAQALADAEIEGADLLVAYPCVGPALGRLAALAAEHPELRLSVLAEDPAAVADVPDGLSVFVDVNPGMHRTGVPLEARATILEVARRAGARFRGVHGYDGHLHVFADGEARRAAAARVYGELLELVDALRNAGIEARELVTSGTPSFRHALAFAPFARLDGTVHRVSPGTVVYHDLRSEEENDDLDLVPAALVLSRVVSHPRPDVATADAGSKAVAAEAGDPCAVALGRPELTALTPSEEHLPFRVAGELPRRGTPLWLFPRHVCPTINLAERAVLVEAGRVVDVVPVSARAHDL